MLRQINAVVVTFMVLASGSAAASAAPVDIEADRTGATSKPVKFPVSVNVALPPGGSAWTASPPLPNSAFSMTTVIKTEKQEAAEAAVDMLVSLAVLPPAKRFLTCAIIAYRGNEVVQSIAKGAYPESAIGFRQIANNQVSMCIQLTQLLQSVGEVSAPPMSLRADACAVASITFPVVAGASGISVTGAPVAKPSPLRVNCAQKGSDLNVKVKPRSKRTKLNKLVGPTLPIGFASSKTATSSVPLTVTYGQPR